MFQFGVHYCCSENRSDKGVGSKALHCYSVVNVFCMARESILQLQKEYICNTSKEA